MPLFSIGRAKGQASTLREALGIGAGMREFKIDRPVRVAWLDEPRRRDVSAEDLPAGTELDREPLILLDLDSRMPGMAKVRVNGREGLVGLRELRAALSEWRPT